MSGLTLEEINTLAIQYEPMIVRTLSEGALTHQMFTTKDFKGDYVEVPMHVRRNAGMGGNTSGGKYKEAGHQSHLKGGIYRSFLDASIAIDDGAEAAAQGRGAARDAVDQELAGISEDMSYFLDSISFGDGSAKVGSLAANVATNTVVIDHTDLFLPQLLNFPGAKLDVYNGATFVETVEIDFVGAVSGGRVGGVTSGEITLELVAGHGLDGTGNGFDLFWRGTNQSSKDLLPQGLNSLLDDIDATFQNIDIGQHPQYTSYVDSNGGTLRDPDVDMFRRAMANIRLKTGVKNMDYEVCMNPATKAQMDRIDEDTLRYFVSDVTLGRAIDGVQTNLGRVSLKEVNACPDNTAYGVDKSQLVRYVQKELGFVRRGGDVLFNSTVNKQIVGNLTAIFECAIMGRNTSFRIDDLDSSEMRRVSFS